MVGCVIDGRGSLAAYSYSKLCVSLREGKAVRDCLEVPGGSLHKECKKASFSIVREMAGDLESHRLPKSPFDGIGSSDDDLMTNDSASTAIDIEEGIKEAPKRTSAELRRVNSHGHCSQHKINMRPIASMANLEGMDSGCLESSTRMKGLTITMKVREMCQGLSVDR